MAEFNKGYYRRQGRKEGAYNEQERIIKLLEADLAALVADNSDISRLQAEVVEDLIALIKGEK